jgi:N-acetylglutamate synthase-like GNAT family acetyltransferase
VESALIHAQLHPESGAVAEQHAGGYAVFSGIGSPFTQALGLGMRGPVQESEIERVEEFFGIRGSTPRIELSPFAHPSLVMVLGVRGYVVAEFTNLLFRVLKGSAPELLSQTGFDVQLCTLDDAGVWAKTVAEGFDDPRVLTEENLKSLTSLFHRANTSCVLTWCEGRPIGAGALSIHEGVAVFYGASTVPAYRKRGVQSLIIRALLARAIAAECELAYTLTKPGSVSQRNLERQGFRVAYTRSLMVREERHG